LTPEIGARITQKSWDKFRIGIRQLRESHFGPEQLLQFRLAFLGLGEAGSAAQGHLRGDEARAR
jgi:hypothetical protein